MKARKTKSYMMKKDDVIEEPVDIVLPWVDGSDEEWIKSRDSYKDFKLSFQEESNGIERYRDWENVKYVFRGIDKYLPWVRNVYFITCGQKLAFLNENCKRLKLINHQDYIPSKYLPTFNSNTIEMNLHRINDLSEYFLLFNDDTFIIDKLKKDYFIKNNVPSDEAVERIIGHPTWNFSHNMATHAWIINKYFNKKEVKRKFINKWFNICYGKDNIRNLIMNTFDVFEGLRHPHEPIVLRKSIMDRLWKLEPELLDNGSQNKFRYITDVTNYLVRYWNVFEGNFNPRKHKGKMWTVNDNNYNEIASSIRKKTYPLLSIDEKIGEKLTKFEEAKEAINSAFEYVLPEKCQFEI